TLKFRFLMIFSCFILIILAISSATYYVLERRALLENQREQTLTTLEQVALVCQESILKKDWINTGNRIRTLSQDASLYSSSCIDRMGKILSDTDAHRIGTKIPVDELVLISRQFVERMLDGD